MSSKKVAKFLAIALGPHVWLPLLFVIIILKSGLEANQLRIIFPSVLLLQVIIPIAYIIVAPKFGWVSEWDMKTRKERQPFFMLMVVLTIASLGVIYFFGNTFLLHLNIIFMVLLLTLFAISLYWKISLHTGLNTASSIIINFMFGWNLPILYLTIPIIFWARLRLKKHSINQLVAGIAVTTIITVGGLALFGYL